MITEGRLEATLYRLNAILLSSKQRKSALSIVNPGSPFFEIQHAHRPDLTGRLSTCLESVTSTFPPIAGSWTCILKAMRRYRYCCKLPSAASPRSLPSLRHVLRCGTVCSVARRAGRPKQAQSGVAVARTTAAVGLNWRTFHRPVGTEYTAMTRLRLQPCGATRAVIEKQARIRGHPLSALLTAMRAGEHRFKLDSLAGFARGVERRRSLTILHPVYLSCSADFAP
jgi:hypothetical protein